MTKRKPPAPFSIQPMPEDIETLPLPTDGPYFVISKDKAFIHKFFHFGRVLYPVKGITTLPDLRVGDKPANAALWATIPEMPAELFGKAWSFFKAVWEKSKSEAMVDITWSEEKGYRLFVPKQSTSAASVECKRKAEDYASDSVIVGTIHSHCDFAAFHSGTDTHDADEHDGFHMTIGNVNLPVPSVQLMIAAGGTRWDAKVSDYTKLPLQLVEHPKWWEDQVTKGSASHKPAGNRPAGTASTDHRSSSKTEAPKPVATAGGRGFGTAARTESEKTAEPKLLTGGAAANDDDEDDMLAAYRDTLGLNDGGYDDGSYGEFDYKAYMRKLENVPKIVITPGSRPSIEGLIAGQKLTAKQERIMHDCLDMMTELDYVMAAVGLQIDYELMASSPVNQELFKRFLDG